MIVYTETSRIGHLQTLKCVYVNSIVYSVKFLFRLSDSVILQLEKSRILKKDSLLGITVTYSTTERILSSSLFYSTDTVLNTIKESPRKYQLFIWINIEWVFFKTVIFQLLTILSRPNITKGRR